MSGGTGGPRSYGLPPGHAPHFRAYERRALRLAISLVGQRSGSERQATIVDMSLAGAGLETEDPLVPGERVDLAFATPTMWDPLVLSGVVAWALPARVTAEVDALGRARTVARAGVAFEYPSPEHVLAMFEMLGALDYE